MKAQHTNLLQFVKNATQFKIPIYQRKYSWQIAQCEQLWQDIIRAGSSDAGNHFVGSVVYIADHDGMASPALVIDGQQRLTTLTLLVSALANAVGETEPVDGFSSAKLRSYYLTNPLEKGERRYKLVLSETDRQTLFSIVDGKALPDEQSYLVKQSHDLFEKKLNECKNDFGALCKGLSRLVIVEIALSRKGDNPQLVFESMNSTGRELSQADLVRNYMLMGLEPEEQKRLYESHWRPMEVAFGQKAYDTHFDKFMRHYLTVKTGDLPRIGEVYEAFKQHAQSRGMAHASAEDILQDLHAFARYYCAMALDAEQHGELKQVFQDLRELKVEVAYPLLLELYHDHTQGTLSSDDFYQVARLVESYVFRRAVCEIPTNSLNKTFATFTKSIDKGKYLESVKVHFQSMPSYRRFPSDAEFEKDIQTRDLYNFRSRSYWLRRLEHHDTKEPAPIGRYTVEHIMPQNQNLSGLWKEALGDDWERVQRDHLHTLGNLTLTGYNPEYSDRSFMEKRDMKGGFKKSPLQLNASLQDVEIWNEQAILRRAATLAEWALAVWAAPDVPHGLLGEYRLTPPDTGGYSADDHPNLQAPLVRKLFDAFRQEVLNLDECISEEFLKHTVSYKAENNVVDVIPQASQLLLYLNMAFADINDPDKICQNKSGIGHLGAGDIEVRFSSLDKLPYIIGLVRQSLERQLGDDSE